MARYEIISDFSDDFSDEHNIREEFTGTWTELQNEIRAMRRAGYYNISANAMDDF